MQVPSPEYPLLSWRGQIAVSWTTQVAIPSVREMIWTCILCFRWISNNSGIKKGMVPLIRPCVGPTLGEPILWLNNTSTIRFREPVLWCSTFFDSRHPSKNASLWLSLDFDCGKTAGQFFCCRALGSQQSRMFLTLLTPVWNLCSYLVNHVRVCTPKGASIVWHL